MSNRQAEPLLRRKDDLHVAYWNVRTLHGGWIQDAGLQALTMQELRTYNVEIACLSKVRIPSGQGAGLTMGLKQAVNTARIMQWFELTCA